MEIYPMYGHIYGPDAWRMCACGRSRPSHTDTAPDPAGGDGCGMTWRICGRCLHIDEHHITENDVTENFEVQPGGYLRQDVPAGLGLPNHQKSSEETAMVSPDRPEVGTLSRLMECVDVASVWCRRSAPRIARLIKLQEEVGEVAQAWIGMTGANPRKGRTHTEADLVAELADVVITAMVALTDYTDPAVAVESRAGFVTARIRDHEQSSPPPGGTTTHLAVAGGGS